MALENTKPTNLILSPAPHIHWGSNLSAHMYTIVIALLPVVIFSVTRYGMDALRVVSLAVGSAMLIEALILLMFRKPVDITDGSAMVTGLIFALLLPPTVPWWLVVVGCFVCILIGKMIFGGIGGNPFNPSLIGWAAVRLSWYDHINFDIAMINYDLNFSAAYPLSVLKNSGFDAVSKIWSNNGLFMGDQIGGIGTAMILLVVAGGIILLVRGVITWEIPLFFIAGTAIGALLFWSADSSKYADPLFHILTGNVMFGAFFLATDFASSPVNRIPKIIFALGCGIFTIIFRVWSKYPDGVVFAILLMNIINPLIDKICPGIPGKPKKKEKV